MAFGNLLFWVIYMVIEKKGDWIIPLYVRFVTLLSITFNDILGEYYNLYIDSITYDRLQHIFGTYALTLWTFFVIQQFIQMKLTNKKLNSVLLVSVALALGSLYELFEFIEDQVFKPHFKNQPSLIDTNLDLLSDLAGGILSVVHYHFSKGLRSFRFPFEDNPS
jgi:uncharacterized membrane protein YjdF